MQGELVVFFGSAGTLNRELCLQNVRASVTCHPVSLLVGEGCFGEARRPNHPDCDGELPHPAALLLLDE